MPSKVMTAIEFYRDWYRRKIEAGDWHPDLNEQDSENFAEMLDAYVEHLRGCHA